MMSLLDVFLAEATDPITVSLSIAAGILCRKWWHVLVASLAIVMLSETLLFVVRPNHKFNPAGFSVAALVPFTVVSLMLAIKKYRARHDVKPY
jgi:hypothetical protein